MASLEASSNPIVVNLTTGATNGRTTVSYKKSQSDELWRRVKGGQWKREADPTTLSGFVGATPKVAGSYVVTLKPGGIYEIGIFARGQGPLGKPKLLAHLTVFAIAKRPRSNLIRSEDANTGGTLHVHTVSTSRPSYAVVASARRPPVTFTSIGFPAAGKSDGDTMLPTASATTHDFLTLPLLPGTPYTYLVVVIDDQGNWDYLTSNFKTLRRKITVQFKTLHIYDDGDHTDFLSGDTGEAGFKFSVEFGLHGRTVIEEFYRPEAEIDDWGETDRPYALGFAHLGDLKSVKEGQQVVFVRAHGTENDAPALSDSAWGAAPLPFPVGSGEKVANAPLLLDCPATDGTPFHFGVDITWSVDYDD